MPLIVCGTVEQRRWNAPHVASALLAFEWVGQLNNFLLLICFRKHWTCYFLLFYIHLSDRENRSPDWVERNSRAAGATKEEVLQSFNCTIIRFTYWPTMEEWAGKWREGSLRVNFKMLRNQNPGIFDFETESRKTNIQRNCDLWHGRRHQFSHNKKLSLDAEQFSRKSGIKTERR